MKFESLRRFVQRYMMTITLAAMIFGLLLVYFAPTVLFTIPAGYRGIMWYRFGGGTDLNGSLSEGTHFKLPWNEVYNYDTRLQVVNQEFDVITKDGLAVKATISFRFRISHRWVGHLHKNVGPDYVKVMLVPEIGSTARVLISQYTAEEFYTTYRLQVQNEILSLIRERLIQENIYSAENVDLIDMDDVMIKEIELPERVASAIERKIEQYQQQLEYDFRLQSEAKEAQRKQIEGSGVRALFDQIGPADVASYLRLAGIHATLQLASSNNAKVVIVGGGTVAGGLPLLLGSDITAAPPVAASAAPGKNATTKLPVAGSLGVMPSPPLAPMPAIGTPPPIQPPNIPMPQSPTSPQPQDAAKP